MLPANANTIIHLAGFGAGVALYGLLAGMTRRAPRSGDRLAFATAVLGLLWNAGALVIFGADDLLITAPPGWVTVVAYAALGFLPAVAVHAASDGLGARARAWVVGAGYGTATSAAGWHALSGLSGAGVPSRDALLLVTTTSLGLVAALLLATRGTASGASSGRRLSLAALAAFAVMALHLGTHADARESWVTALIGHHASLPLAFAILYLDYRFALADVFLKRALTLGSVGLLAGAVLLGVALPALQRTTLAPTAVALTLACWVATALATPAIERAIGRFVDRVLLRRRQAAQLLPPLREQLARAESSADVLRLVERTLAEALTAESVTSRERTPVVADAGVAMAARDTAATVVIPTTESPAFEVTVEGLAGGRRLLSEDRQLLAAIATVAGRRIDALRVADERLARDLREESLLRLSSEAELQALRAQLNPHFLFNALTTLGFLMRAAPDRAMAALYNLTSLLRAVLGRSHGEHTSLAEEFALVRDYLAIEQARFEERLEVELDLPASLADQSVPPLVLQPLVENAVKHGISPLGRGGRVSVRARVASGQLELTVEDTGRGTAAAQTAPPIGTGVGLANLERRLERIHGSAASLSFESRPGTGTRVVVRLPLGATTTAWRAAS